MSNKIYTMSIPEKLTDVIKRNVDSFQVEHKETIWSNHSLTKHIDSYYISFYSNSFGTGKLNYIFSYWGLNWQEWVLNFDLQNNNAFDLDALYDLYFKNPEEKIKELKNKIVNNFHDIDDEEEIPENIVSKIKDYVDYEWNQDLEDNILGYSNYIQIWIKKQIKKCLIHKYKKVYGWGPKICNKCGKFKRS
ncbi:MAG: hypothetical protein ACFFKA_19280 [Candidatus Thorarchaeota archaeon]